VLLPWASELDTVDPAFRDVLTKDLICSIIELVPEEWLINEVPGLSAAEIREGYLQFIITRLTLSEKFVGEAKHARQTLI
jgi:hypothetical protein